MALRTGILKLSNLRCVTQQASRLRAMSTQSTQTSPKEGPATATEEMKPGQTHFGFQVVAEEEKTKKGNIFPFPVCVVISLYTISRSFHSVLCKIS